MSVHCGGLKEKFVRETLELLWRATCGDVRCERVISYPLPLASAITLLCIDEGLCSKCKHKCRHYRNFLILVGSSILVVDENMVLVKNYPWILYKYGHLE